MPRVLLATLTALMLVAVAACGEETPDPTGPADGGYGMLFDRLALEPGRPLHLALAAAVDEAGQRAALVVVVRHDEAAARTDTERLERNLAATGRADRAGRAEVSREGATVVVDWFREDMQTVLNALQRLDFGIVEVAVPAGSVDADQ